MDKKLKNIIFIVCGIFLIIIILLFVIAGCSKKNYTALELEDLKLICKEENKKEICKYILQTFKNAKEFGSLIKNGNK